jgi:hypothetical protein
VVAAESRAPATPLRWDPRRDQIWDPTTSHVTGGLHYLSYLVPLRATVWVTVGHRSIRFPDDLEAKLMALAESEDRSFSRVVVRTLEQALSGPGASLKPSGVSSPGSLPGKDPVATASHSAPARAPSTQRPYVKPFRPAQK